MNTFRSNGIIGEYEIDNLLEVSSIHFSEWNNGEGLDFVLSNSESVEIQKFSLSIEQLNALAVIGHAIGYIEMGEVICEAERYKKESKDREKIIQQFRDKYRTTQ